MNLIQYHEVFLVLFAYAYRRASQQIIKVYCWGLLN